MESGYVHEKSGELFCTATEMDITKRLKAMLTGNGRARKKPQTDSGA